MFEIHLGEKSGEFYFRLKGANGLTILSSEGYSTKQACKGGIRSVQKNAVRLARFTVKEVKNGKSYFTIDARNGDVIDASQMYASRSGMKKGICVQSNAPSSEVKDLTA